MQVVGTRNHQEMQLFVVLMTTTFCIIHLAHGSLSGKTMIHIKSLWREKMA